MENAFSSSSSRREYAKLVSILIADFEDFEDRQLGMTLDRWRERIFNAARKWAKDGLNNAIESGEWIAFERRTRLKLVSGCWTRFENADGMKFGGSGLRECWS